LVSAKGNVRGEIFTSCDVLEERHDEAGVIFRVRAHPRTLERLRGLLATNPFRS
jgi:hypothetical protein